MNTTYREMVTHILDSGGLSQPALAKKIGCTQPTVSRIKRGVIEVKKIKMAEAITSAYIKCLEVQESEKSIAQ